MENNQNRTNYNNFNTNNFAPQQQQQNQNQNQQQYGNWRSRGLEGVSYPEQKQQTAYQGNNPQRRNFNNNANAYLNTYNNFNANANPNSNVNTYNNFNANSNFTSTAQGKTYNNTR